VKYSSNLQYTKNLSAILFKDSDGIVCLNMSAFFPVEFLKLVFIVKINNKSSPKAKSYDQEIFSASFDTCKVEKGIFGNFIAKMMVEQMKDKSSFNFTCGYKSGPFYIKNLAPPRGDLIPVALISTNAVIHWELNCVLKAKVKSSKALVHAYSLKLQGETR
jgi:Protein of unknown function (DUF1091)